MSIEAAAVIGVSGNIIYEHLPPGRSAGYLPDSRDLWEDGIWANKDRIYAIAHSHPGSGLPHPSRTDITTFSAIELGLGKRLKWFICSADQLIVVYWEGPDKYDYVLHPLTSIQDSFAWLQWLRENSNYK